MVRGICARRATFQRSTDGATAIEYSLIAALIVIVIIGTLSLVRANLLALPFPALIAAFSGAQS